MIHDFINNAHELGTDNDKKKFSRAWIKSKNKCDTYQVITWSKYVKYSMILKHRSNQVKRNLLEKIKYSKDKRVSTRKFSLKIFVRAPRRVKEITRYSNTTIFPEIET